MSRYLRARSGRPRRNLRASIPKAPPRKEQAPCCQQRRDHLGRLPVGFCSPDCIRRPDVWYEVAP